MGMFSAVATAQLKLLFVVLLLGTGNAFRAVPAPSSPAAATACGADLRLRVVLARRLLPLTAYAAFLLLLAVRAELRAAEAEAESAGGAGPFDDDAATGRRRRRLWLRRTLLLAVLLSFAASLLAVVAFEDGFRYRTGCRADLNTAGYGRYGAGSPLGVLMMGVFALAHGFFAWAAVTQN